jgi:hypothetical protein
MDLAYFSTVIDQVASFVAGFDDTPLHLLQPEEADALFRKCQILDRVTKFAPDIVDGPIRLDQQYWVATGRPGHLPPSSQQLSQSSFVDAADSPEVFSTKPFHVGLFSSTGVLDTFGMWHIYLDMNRGSSLYPPPWYTWAVEMQRNVAVREITSASEWVNFVDDYPRSDGRFLYPDWRRAAKDYDGVHVTLRALAAIEGLPFPGRHGIVAPSFWGVESTLWLHWHIVDHSLREKIS